MTIASDSAFSLPIGQSWSPEIELWGSVDSDRIDVVRSAGTVPEVFCRFDLREWKPDLYRRFLECMLGIRGRLNTADGEAVALDREAFEDALRSSAAARFAANPEQFLRDLSSGDRRR
jgi:hypothetical protein